MLSFWAGGISSFSPCAREYRLLRRLNSEWITFIVIFKRTSFDVSLFYSISYFFINKRVHIIICSTYILTFNLSHEVARIFFSFVKRMQEFFCSSISCMNIFLYLTPPPPLPGYLMVHLKQPKHMV